MVVSAQTKNAQQLSEEKEGRNDNNYNVGYMPSRNDILFKLHY